MTMRITEIWRHPIKSHGRELLDQVVLEVGKTMPWDRTWAVLHEASKFDRSAPGWAPCGTFGRVAKSPELAAVNANFNPETGLMILTHPRRAPIEFDPETKLGEQAFLNWVRPLYPEGRAGPTGLVAAPGRGMTDSDYPSVSINSHASLRALSQRAGRELSAMRFRGNLWVDGLAAWEEFDWIGKKLRIGDVILHVEERIARCTATTANPETGRIDFETVKLLEQDFGHSDFGVKAQVVKGGAIANGAEVTLL